MSQTGSGASFPVAPGIVKCGGKYGTLYEL